SSTIPPPPRTSAVSPPPRSSAISPGSGQNFPRIGTPTLPTPIGSPSHSRPPSSASSSLAYSEDEDEADEGEDPWGLSGSPSGSPAQVAASLPEPIQVPATSAPSSSLQPPHKKTGSLASIDVEEDAWGLSFGGESPEVESPIKGPTSPVSPVVPGLQLPVATNGGRARAGSLGSINSVGSGGGEDAWGFGEEDEVDLEAGFSGGEEDKEEVLRLRGGMGSPVSERGESEQEKPVAEDPWGLGEEFEGGAEEVRDVPPRTPHTPEPTPSLTLASPFAPKSYASGTHVKKESIDGGAWGWDEDAVPEQVPVAPKQGDLPTKVGSNAVRKPTSRTRIEKMMVSKRSRAIAKIAEEVLVEAFELGESGFRYATFVPAATPLLRSFTSILSLYRATAPVHHSKLLLSVPALGMQFANDAEWIGDEVEKTWQRLAQGRDKEFSQATEVEHAVGRMRTMAFEWRQRQVEIQKAALMECLDEANRFLRTGEDQRFAACERSLAQVIHTLDRLAQAWKPVMNATRFYATLGGLVNDVLLRVLNEIEDQVDISEEESIRLNRLCKVLHGLEKLFESNNFSVGAEVPIWFKFVFLSEFLEASMADILFLFDHRHLVDFSIDEISRLVRALFSDSPVRAKNLEHISRGHPTEVREDSMSGSDEEEGNGWR
ncbi:hypothetical protein P7C70_g7668, partial [Phenoliferia sp. Uapishka_3]